MMGLRGGRAELDISDTMTDHEYPLNQGCCSLTVQVQAEWDTQPGDRATSRLDQ